MFYITKTDFISCSFKFFQLLLVFEELSKIWLKESVQAENKSFPSFPKSLFVDLRKKLSFSSSNFRSSNLRKSIDFWAYII